MLWEAAQFRRRFFDLGDLPEQVAKIADLGDVNITFVPRTRRPASRSPLPTAYDLATTRSRLTHSLMKPNRSWRRWSPRTGQKDHWLAAPFSPMGRVGRLNKILTTPRQVGLRDGRGRHVPARHSRHVPRGQPAPAHIGCGPRQAAQDGPATGFGVDQVDAFFHQAGRRRRRCGPNSGWRRSRRRAGTMRLMAPHPV